MPTALIQKQNLKMLGIQAQPGKRSKSRFLAVAHVHALSAIIFNSLKARTSCSLGSAADT